jgi:hypothetical protein
LATMSGWRDLAARFPDTTQVGAPLGGPEWGQLG